jgi:microcystin-dependent protein
MPAMSEPYIGEIRLFGGGFAPDGWALCDGRILSVADQPDLYAVIGRRYGGAADGTFAVPDLMNAATLGGASYIIALQGRDPEKR